MPSGSDLNLKSFSNLSRSSNRLFLALLLVKRSETRRHILLYGNNTDGATSNTMRMCTALRTCARAWICVRMKRERECKVC